RSVVRVQERTGSTLAGRPPPHDIGQMTSLAFVFPGQGSQVVGMGQAPAAARVFAEADAALGEPISRLAWDGPEEALNRTEQAQPALLATSIAYLEALRERGAA